VTRRERHVAINRLLLTRIRHQGAEKYMDERYLIPLLVVFEKIHWKDAILTEKQVWLNVPKNTSCYAPKKKQKLI